MKTALKSKQIYNLYRILVLKNVSFKTTKISPDISSVKNILKMHCPGDVKNIETKHNLKEMFSKMFVYLGQTLR